MSKRQQSNIVAVLVLLVSVFFFVESLSISVDGGYPKVICVALAILSAWDFIQNYLDAREERKLPHHELTEDEMTTEELAEHMVSEHDEKVPWQDLVAVVIISFASLILWEYISFLFAGILAIMALSIYKKRPILKSLIVAVCTVVIIQLIFRNIFTIPLPSPSWWPMF